MDPKDWIQTISTLVLAGTAFLAPYLIERWKYTYRSPKLKIYFKLYPPYCHQTQMGSGNTGFPVYYFRFLVKNTGKTQAENCEVLLERVSKENSAGEMIELKNFSAINLKWSGIRDQFTRTIQPERKMFCDIGRIHHPNNNYQSIYKNISDKEQKTNKFAFEFPERYFGQWDCLIHGKYKLFLSIYSKNANKVTKEFNLSWSGEWKDSEAEMFDELVIS